MSLAGGCMYSECPGAFQNLLRVKGDFLLQQSLMLGVPVYS